MSRAPVLVPPLRNLTLKTKLLLMMLSLLALSVFSLFLLHLYSERKLLSQLREYTEDLSTAIEVFQEQPAGEGDPQVVLQAYAQKLRQLGVKDVSMADASDEVQASTNPQNVGKRLVRSAKKKGPKEYVIRGVLGDESGPPGSQKTTTLSLPIVVGDARVGNLVITRYLDDFSALSHEAFLNRLVATLAVFALGILLSLYLSWTFSRPLQGLTDAARQVAAGDLSVQVPQRGGKDEIGSLSRTFNEMVERLRENRLLEERLHFAERSTAMGRLASAMAHEIRNPLNFINLSIDHVRARLGPEESPRKEDFEKVLANMKAEISRLNRLVGDFLSFGKPMRLHPRLCAIEEVLREVAALVEHKARDQGIALTLEAEDALPRVVADPELLKTCFLNLMINAVDAMPGGGDLRVDVRRTRESGGDGLAITVTDTGRGMSSEEVRTAFEPYFSTKDAGLGLGLALTRKILSDHGGSIVLDSAEGRGTTARIVLPLIAEGLAPVEPREAVAR
jgi:nitrogen fixation/metabolism regulation signal transduction histidine kinase